MFVFVGQILKQISGQVRCVRAILLGKDKQHFPTTDEHSIVNSFDCLVVIGQYYSFVKGSDGSA